MIIGIDTGGTFTDFIWLGEDGRPRLHKQPATPDDPSRAVLDGLTAAGAPLGDIVHGSTVATNALLERRGARTALLTTAGFRDVLAIGRQNRPDLYALVPQKPPPLVPRELRFEVDERVAATGEVVRPLDEAQLAAILREVAAAGVESVAVCLLFSFLHPDHERRVGELARAALGPGVHVSLSVDVLPEYREYERTAATVINAFVAPLMSRYLARLAGRLAPRRLAIMQSNGGVISAAAAGAQAARTALSGPAGGVVGAMWVAATADGRPSSAIGVTSDELRATSSEGSAALDAQGQADVGRDGIPPGREGIPRAGWQPALQGPSAARVAGGPQYTGGGDLQIDYANLITFDMGGTSTDVALCPGRLPMTTEGEIAGLPLRLPLIDIHTVGAGGGSLAHVDRGGALLVGPQSAGAVPGPAAYHADYDAWRAALDAHFAPGRATVSDANLVLGRLDAAHFLGGAMALHPASARRALLALAEDLGMMAAGERTGAAAIQAEAGAAEEAAWAVLRVANAAMERAVRRISVERGHDPRRFTLVAFGGGGPLHTCELAAALRIPRVLIPPTPGVLSALGLLVAAPRRDFSRTVMLVTSDELRVTSSEGASSLSPSPPFSPSIETRLEEIFAKLEAQAIVEMNAEGHDPAGLALERSLDARYRGQSHELAVAYAPGMDAAEIAASLHAAHAARYGYARPEAAVEVVTARLAAVAPAAVPQWPRRAAGGPDPAAALLGHKPVWFEGGFVTTPLYDRARLRPGNILAGPGVLYQYDTTTIIPPGWVGWVDGVENLILEKENELTTDHTD